MITFRASEDGMCLEVRKIIEEHNHPISRVIVESYERNKCVHAYICI